MNIELVATKQQEAAAEATLCSRLALHDGVEWSDCGMEELTSNRIRRPPNFQQDAASAEACGRGLEANILGTDFGLDECETTALNICLAEQLAR